MPWHLAIDFGASSGRHILGRINNGRLECEEIHRFDNGFSEINGTMCWNSEQLFREIVTGLKLCRDAGKMPETVAIDTWGVDFALLDENGSLIGNTVSYRDARTDGIPDEIHSIISEQELFRRTGIQSHSFNTVNQLYAIKKRNPRQLENARTLLFLPDYFAYKLTGVKQCERTIASTSELLSIETGDWDRELMQTLGLDASVMLPVSEPFTPIGKVLPEIAHEIGYSPVIVRCGSHDTASAVAAVPSTKKDTLYISSGTWSLMGIEAFTPIVSRECMETGLTNESGCGGSYRILKNIMGLWLIQCVRREQGKRHSFEELCTLAEQAQDAGGFIDVCDPRFLAPESMTDTIRMVCAESGLRVPETPGELARVIYHSLAHAYAQCAKELETFSGVSYDCINVIGGGSNASYLNRLTAEYSGKTVLAGPGEATAIGNLCAQLIACGELAGLTQARELVMNSFDIKRFDGADLKGAVIC